MTIIIVPEPIKNNSAALLRTQNRYRSLSSENRKFAIKSFKIPSTSRSPSKSSRIAPTICRLNSRNSRILNRRRLFFNFIPHSPHRLYEFRIARLFVHLFADAPDMDHHRIVGLEVFFLPDAFKQILRTDDLAPILTQHLKN